MKYGISYQVVYDMYVEVEAEDSVDAADMLLTSIEPATDVYGFEPQFMDKQLVRTNIHVEEVDV